MSQTREIEEHITFSKDKLEVHRGKMATTPNYILLVFLYSSYVFMHNNTLFFR